MATYLETLNARKKLINGSSAFWPALNLWERKPHQLYLVFMRVLLLYLLYTFVFRKYPFSVSNARVLISVGPLFVNTSVPKMEEVEKRMAVLHGGWVSNGGTWKPTQCKARVKVCCLFKLLS